MRAQRLGHLVGQGNLARLLVLRQGEERPRVLELDLPVHAHDARLIVDILLGYGEQLALSQSAPGAQDDQPLEPVRHRVEYGGHLVRVPRLDFPLRPPRHPDGLRAHRVTGNAPVVDRSVQDGRQRVADLPGVGVSHPAAQLLYPGAER